MKACTALPVEKGASILSFIQTRFSRPRTRPSQHYNTIQPTRQGLWGTLVGPGRTPTVHRCPEGKAVGGPLVPRQTTSLETNVLSATRRQDKRAVQQPGADSHLESYNLLKNNKADEVFSK